MKMNEDKWVKRLSAGEEPPSRGLVGWITDNTIDFVLGVCLVVSAMVYFCI